VFVLDASAALAWCLEDEASDTIDGALDDIAARGAHVPMLWPIEICNALLHATRRKRMTAAQMRQKLELLASLPLTPHQIDLTAAFGKLLDHATDHHLTVYDASYLDLAVRLQIPLVTLDRELIKAARRIGLGVIAA
jgi:predicted nucleic acid-binding protein